MASAAQIRQQLRRLVLNQQTLRKFVDWFTDATWSEPLAGETLELADAIELILVDYSDKQLTASEVRTRLATLIRDPRLTPPPPMTAITTNTTTATTFTVWIQAPEWESSARTLQTEFA